MVQNFSNLWSKLRLKTPSLMQNNCYCINVYLTSPIMRAFLLKSYKDKQMSHYK